MTRRILFAALLFAACHDSAQSPGAPLHLPQGFKISVFATGLDDPRTMLLTPNGDVLVAEPGGGKVTLLRDANHDGVAEQKFNFISGLDEPFGLAFNGTWLYIGNADSVVRVPYAAGQTASNAQPQRLASLPTGGHSTRGVLFN